MLLLVWDMIILIYWVKLCQKLLGIKQEYLKYNMKSLVQTCTHSVSQSGVPAFTSLQSPEALKILLSRSKELGSSSLLISPEPSSYPNTIWGKDITSLIDYSFL